MIKYKLRLFIKNTDLQVLATDKVLGLGKSQHTNICVCVTNTHTRTRIQLMAPKHKQSFGAINCRCQPRDAK